MTSFAIYRRQRFNTWLFTALSFYLLLFANASFEFEPSDAYKFIFILFSLLAMRLYDDLQSVRIDEGKSDRIYTDPVVAKELTFVLIGLLFFFLTALLFVNWLLALYALVFLSVNHVIYLFLFQKNDFNYFLPLLKYPALVWALTEQLSFDLPALFFAFLVFEAIDDKQFPIRGSYTYYLAAVAFGLLSIDLPLYNAWMSILLFAISVLVIFINSKYSPYIFIALFLLGRLTLLFNEI